MRINCFGEETKDLAYDKNPPVEPLETKVSGGSTYLRFGEGGRVPIHRLTIGADGLVQRRWAFGKWEDAESLDYIPATETMEVDG